jgi:predicted LPLAT superfamily acyltransferase
MGPASERTEPLERAERQSAGPDTSERGPEWTRRPERGSATMVRLGVLLALRLGRRATRALLLVPIALYFFVLSPRERDASRNFLRRALGREPRRADLFRHFVTFATTILDRIYLLNGQYGRYDVRVFGEHVPEEMAARGEGCLLLGAHLGSFEILRFRGREAGDVRVSLVMYEENARQLNAILDAIAPSRRMPVIPLGKIESMLKVQDALARGEFVGLLADRSIEGEGTDACPFLGSEAKFPKGPFRLAVMLKRPVVLMFGLYRGGNRYDIHFEELIDLRDAARPQRQALIAEARKRYVERLEHYARLAPYNWFNFYDFWK